MLQRKFISIVSTALLAVHVSVGCCAHHQHGHAGNACISHATHHHDGHLAHDGTCDHSVPPDDQQPGDHHCGEGRCAFLAGSKVSMPELSMAYAIVPTSAAVLVAQYGQPSVAKNAPADSTASLPVRSHLIKQVLLI